jgi:hypothetical protein
VVVTLQRKASKGGIGKLGRGSQEWPDWRHLDWENKWLNGVNHARAGGRWARKRPQQSKDSAAVINRNLDVQKD